MNSLRERILSIEKTSGKRCIPLRRLHNSMIGGGVTIKEKLVELSKDFQRDVEALTEEQIQHYIASINPTELKGGNDGDWWSSFLSPEMIDAANTLLPSLGLGTMPEGFNPDYRVWNSESLAPPESGMGFAGALTRIVLLFAFLHWLNKRLMQPRRSTRIRERSRRF